MTRTLIAEDEFTSRKIMNAILAPLGPCDTAKNGAEAVAAFEAALGKGERYDLVCLDIHMPDLDGHAVLRRLRELEASRNIGGLDRVKVVMTTASSARQDIMGAFRSEADAYVVKPVEKAAFLEKLAAIGIRS